MFTKILVANRGEIACRVINTARQMGIRTVAVYSDADREAQHVKQADEAIHIGGSASKDSYLIAEKIVAAALQTNAQAIHPGYGFLSENAAFAQQCEDQGLVFIGPPINAIEAMGSKSAAKTIMEQAQVPLVPGYHGDNQDTALLRKMADQMGYPVLLKAVAGGGGKGMRQVWASDEFDAALCQAKSEAMASFNDDKMLVEKYLTQPRHVEFQIFCDQHNNGVYLFERDCSVQRRHQKIIEEAPAPNLSEDLRRQMGDAALRAAQAINYQGAGTVEFLLDTDDSFYFMEMNTRLQVEHPVTEMITGQDLVAWQLQVANGETLPLTQDQLSIEGHSFEARIYAEDANNEFLPTTGDLNFLQTPKQNSHVRVDTGVVQGDQVSPFYDPMIAKLIVWDKDRRRALSRLAHALTEYRISGVTTNIQFLYNLATNEAFQNAELNTGFIEKNRHSLFHKTGLKPADCLCLITLYLILRHTNTNATSPWEQTNAWRLNQANRHSYEVIIQETPYSLSARELTQQASGKTRSFKMAYDAVDYHANGELIDSVLIAEINGHRQQVTIAACGDNLTLFSYSGALDFHITKPDLGDDKEPQNNTDFTAPMNGTVVDVLIKSGAQVNQGDALVVIEAMKMQHTIHAPCAGTVNQLFCSRGDLVDGGIELLSFAPHES